MFSTKFALLFLLISSVAWCDEKPKDEKSEEDGGNKEPSKFTEEMIENLVPEGVGTHMKKLTAEQFEAYTKFRAQVSQAKNEDEAKKIADDFRAQHSDIYEIIKPAIEHLHEKLEKIGPDAREFSRFYAEHISKIDSDEDDAFAKFFCTVLPEWNKLSEDGKKDIREHWPKIAKNLENDEVRKAAECK